MILNTQKNRRAPARRAVLLALVPATVTLGMLAAVRPMAQAAPAPAPAPSGEQTLANGAAVSLVEKTPTPGGPLTLALHYAPTAQPGNIWVAPPAFGAFYLSQGGGLYARKPDVIWAGGPDSLTDAPGPTAGERNDGTLLYAFSKTLPATVRTLDVGVAAGPWTITVDCPKTPGKVRLARPDGPVIWTLTVHSGQAGALLMVSDHFHTPSPLPSQNSTQTAMHDIGSYQRVVYALDGAGRVLAEVAASSLTTPDSEGPSLMGDPIRYKIMQTAHVSGDILRRTATFRLVLRPYQWTKLAVGAQSARR